MSAEKTTIERLNMIGSMLNVLAISDGLSKSDYKDLCRVLEEAINSLYAQTDRERKLYEALENLVEYQNGVPLARYEKEYNEAYDNAIKTLNECKPNK